MRIDCKHKWSMAFDEGFEGTDKLFVYCQEHGCNEKMSMYKANKMLNEHALYKAAFDEKDERVEFLEKRHSTITDENTKCEYCPRWVFIDDGETLYEEPEELLGPITVCKECYQKSFDDDWPYKPEQEATHE